MTNEIKFADTVILVDVAYVDRVAGDLSKHFGDVVGVDSYGVGGGLGGKKTMRIELSAFRHNRFNRYRRCFVVVP